MSKYYKITIITIQMIFFFWICFVVKKFEKLEIPLGSKNTPNSVQGKGILYQYVLAFSNECHWNVAVLMSKKKKKYLPNILI